MTLRIAIAFDSDEDAKYRAKIGSAQKTLFREFSCQGSIRQVVLSVESILRAVGHEVWHLPVVLPISTTIDCLGRRAPDVIFNLCEGVGGASEMESRVAALFDLAGIPYTGSDPDVLSLALDKGKTKFLLQAQGVSTAPFVILDSLSEIEGRLPKFPLIVKPLREDASLGITSDSVVEDIHTLERQVQRIQGLFGPGVLVEQYIPGREFNVTVIGNEGPKVFPLAEIDFSGFPKNHRRIVTYAAKWKEGSEDDIGSVPICPAEVATDVADRIRDAACNAYRIVGCRDYGRVDMRLATCGRPYVLEVNPNPDLSPDAGVCRALRAGGWSYKDLVLWLVREAVSRGEAA